MPSPILLVEDDPALSRALSVYLPWHGFEVDWASNLRDATRCLRTRTYAAVLTDLHLGPATNRDGLQVISSAGLLQSGLRGRVVLMTGLCTIEDERDARANGVHAILSKPFELAALARTLQDIVRPPAVSISRRHKSR